MAAPGAAIGRCVACAQQLQHRVPRDRVTPVRAGDKIFCVDTEGTVVCIAADKEFKELGRTELKELCRSTPAIANGQMYVRTVGHLLSVGRLSGAE